MPLTSLQASTAILLHCEDFANSGTVRGIGTQTYPSEPVSTSATTAKFGTRSIDTYTPNYGGLRFVGKARRIAYMPMTLEGWVYVRNFRASARNFFGVFSASLSIITVSHDSAGRPSTVFRDDGNNANLISGSTALSLNQWNHIALSVSGNALRRLFVNGTQVASSSSVASGTPSSSSNGDFVVGGAGYSDTLPLDGYVDEIRCVFGHELYTADFTPPTAPYDDIPLLDGVAKTATVFSKPLGSFATTPKRYAPFVKVKDTYFGGRGQIIATVKEKNTPVNTPLRRKVWLIRERDAQIVRETWSNAATGAYAFTNIDETEKYTVVSYDYLNNYRAVIADNLTPELMP